MEKNEEKKEAAVGAVPAPQENGEKKEEKETAIEGEKTIEEVEEELNSVVMVKVEIEVFNGKKITYELPSVVQLAEVRQYLIDSEMWFVTRYQFMHKGKRVSDYVVLGSLIGKDNKGSSKNEVNLKLVTQNYDLQSSLFHLKNLRNKLFPTTNGSSMSLFYSIAGSRDAAAVAGGAKKSKNKKKNKKKNKNNNGNNNKEETAGKKEGEGNNKSNSDNSNNKKAEKKKEEKVVAHLESDFSKEDVSLADYFPSNIDTVPVALKYIGYSAWNPVPSYRRLQGDLFYLDVSTLENRDVVLTASEKGFFINSSTKTKFDPTPSSECKSLLPDLFSSISDLFKGNFASINKRNAKIDSIETLSHPGGPVPWLKVSPKSSLPNRTWAEEDFLRVNGVCHAVGLQRDWNEEYQILYAQASLPSDNRFATLNNLFRVHNEFVEACQRGAKLVVDGGVSPLNPYDAEGSQMWMHDNIFFSIAANVNGMFDGLGGDVAAHKNASHEITGIKLMRMAGVHGLHAVAQVIVDYRGRRIVCQSVVPGLLTQYDTMLEEQQKLLQQQQDAAAGSVEGEEEKKAEEEPLSELELMSKRHATSPHTFGPSDDFKSYNANPEFADLVKELGKKAGLKKSVISLDGGETKHEIGGPLELRGLIGGDKRKYVFELLRMYPRDANFPEQDRSYCLYRPELLELFRDHVANLAVQEYKKKRDAREKEKQEKKEKGEEVDETAKPEDDVIYLPNMEVNVNVFVRDGNLVYEVEEESGKDKSMLEQVGKFLTSLAIPGFINACAQVNMPSDLTVLVPMMHERGINARYLGVIAESSATPLPVLSLLCKEEMIVRGAKAVLRKRLAAASVGESAGEAKKFLNSFLGKPRGGAKNAFAGDRAVWEEIRKEISWRFKFDLKLDNKLSDVIRKMSLLRSLCIAVGLTVEARKYDFTVPEPFSADDILEFHALVRHSSPELPDIAELMVKAREFLTSPQLMNRGIELLEQSLQAVYHIMGPFTAHAANAHQLLANAYYAQGDPHGAVQHTQRAVLILERLNGLDHEGTVRAYGNLATFYSECGMFKQALTFFRRALYLEKLINGANHHTVVNTLSNLATVLKNMGDVDGGIRALMQCLEAYERTNNQVMVIHTCRALARFYQAAGKFKEAIRFEKRYNKVITQYYPADNEKVVESNSLLSDLTGAAVRDAKDRLQQQAARQPTNAKDSKKKPVRVLPGKPGSKGSNMPLSHVLSLINKGKKK